MTEPIEKLTEHEFGDWTRTNDGSLQRVCLCGETEIKQIENKAESLSETSDGIKIDITTDNAIPEGTVLKTENLTGQLSDNEKQSLTDAIEVIATDGVESELVSLFEIHLEMNGSKVQPDGMVKVELPIPEGANELYNSFKIVYIDDNGAAHDMPTEVKDGKIVFTTDHFSHYAIVGLNSLPETGDNRNIVFGYALLFFSCCGIVVICFSRKKRGLSK